MCWVGLALSETPSAAVASTGGSLLVDSGVLHAATFFTLFARSGTPFVADGEFCGFDGRTGHQAPESRSSQREAKE